MSKTADAYREWLAGLKEGDIVAFDGFEENGTSHRVTGTVDRRDKDYITVSHWSIAQTFDVVSGQVHDPWGIIWKLQPASEKDELVYRISHANLFTVDLETLQTIWDSIK